MAHSVLHTYATDSKKNSMLRHRKKQPFLRIYTEKECTCKYSKNKINISIYSQQIQPNKLTKTFPSRISSRERKPLFKPESQSEQASVGKKKKKEVYSTLQSKHMRETHSKEMQQKYRFQKKWVNIYIRIYSGIQWYCARKIV